MPKLTDRQGTQLAVAVLALIAIAAVIFLPWLLLLILLLIPYHLTRGGALYEAARYEDVELQLPFTRSWIVAIAALCATVGVEFSFTRDQVSTYGAHFTYPHSWYGHLAFVFVAATLLVDVFIPALRNLSYMRTMFLPAFETLGHYSRDRLAKKYGRWSLHDGGSARITKPVFWEKVLNLANARSKAMNARLDRTVVRHRELMEWGDSFSNRTRKLALAAYIFGVIAMPVYVIDTFLIQLELSGIEFRLWFDQFINE